MSITINAIELCMDLPDWMTAEEIRLATVDDKSEYVLHGWPSTITEVQKKLQL